MVTSTDRFRKYPINDITYFIEGMHIGAHRPGGRPNRQRHVGTVLPRARRRGRWEPFERDDGQLLWHLLFRSRER